MTGQNITVLLSWMIEIEEQTRSKLRAEILAYANQLGLFASPAEAPLPPLKPMTHRTPLIDELCVYPWRSVRSPEALRPQWNDKRKGYLKAGRWQITSSANTIPILRVPKLGRPRDEPEFQILFDTRARSANTRKLSSLMRYCEEQHRETSHPSLTGKIPMSRFMSNLPMYGRLRSLHLTETWLVTSSKLATATLLRHTKR